MTAVSISFYASAVLAVAAALVAVLARAPERALAGFAVALASLLVPLIQLRATTVAAVVLLAAAVIVVLLGALARVRGPGRGARGRLPIAYWLPAGLGLLGFVWVMLATGSRQVVEYGKPLEPESRFGDGSALLMQLGNEFAIPALLVALLALCAVVAAVLSLGTSRAS